MVPPAGFEPATIGFRDRSSATELTAAWAPTANKIAAGGKVDLLGVCAHPFENAFAHLVDLLPFDFEAGRLDAAEHQSIAMDLAETGYEESNRLRSFRELIESVGLEGMDVHIHGDQASNLSCNLRTIAVVKKALAGDCCMIGKVLSSLLIVGHTERLTAIVINLVSLGEVEVEQLCFDERAIDPAGQPPLSFKGLTMVITIEVPEPGGDTFAVLEDGHVLELEAGFHRRFEFFFAGDNLQHSNSPLRGRLFVGLFVCLVREKAQTLRLSQHSAQLN